MTVAAASTFFSPPSPRILAHRGLALDAPENTLAAFAAAADLGVQNVETDVHATADGIAVISHDADLARVARDPRPVSELTMAQLREVDLGGGQGYCSLSEALGVFPWLRFNIDVKSDDAVDPTVEAILSAGALDRVLVTSFSERRRTAATRQPPSLIPISEPTRRS
ncbi:glycerophosphodiester phosphodiesterase family protein [Marisediminicola senii]|uniref:glycerophosphodiester phosphodiesterase family protein n=1 Tax=Marisediminicola senii TaxID=2711233 RepID=UPI0013EAD7CD|nr:glycerophosphodiester phosphodiesterase family protein [Marisediminicola senii]